MKKEIIGDENNNIKSEQINIKYEEDDDVNANINKLLFNRKLELESIHKTAALIKMTTDRMYEDLEYQGAQLEDVEFNCIKSEEDYSKS